MKPMRSHTHFLAAALVLAVYLPAGSAVASPTSLTAVERKGIQDALFIGNMTLEDLKFPRLAADPKFQIAFVTQSIEDPLKTADDLMAAHASTKGKTAVEALAAALGWLNGGTVSVTPSTDEQLEGLESVAAPIRSLVGDLVTAIIYCNTEIREATSRLSESERRELIELLSLLAISQDQIAIEFASQRSVDRERVYALLERVDLDRILSAGHRLARVVDSVEPRLAGLNHQQSETVKLRIGGIPVVLGSVQDDHHSDRDAMLTIDFGGNDTYTGRHGAGIGYASVHLDLGGNDRYDVPDASLGVGILGVGIARARVGHDLYTTKSFALGVGIAGVGIFERLGGHDTYRSVACAQGFGFFGVGILRDSAGNDDYRLEIMGQGAARTKGVGWLIDEQGSDRYSAGGTVLSQPLFATATYGFAQGFSTGFREDSGGEAGGIGLLTDHGGDDVFSGGTYVQAASYWFALGSLYSAAGNNRYTAYHYAQSSAMHICSAYLFDLAGDDIYAIQVGAGHAIGHDYGVAFFLDRAGDDIYAGRDTQPGLGNANGLGIFVDAGGIDRYAGTPGVGNAARGAISIGVFADLGGTDRFMGPAISAFASAGSSRGVSLNVESIGDTATVSPSTPDTPEPGSLQMRTDPEMRELYRRAAQWGVGTAVEDVEEAIAVLIGIGEPALEWMLQNELEQAQRLEIRAFVRVVRGIGAPATAVVGRKALQANSEEMANLIRIAIDANLNDFALLLPRSVDDPNLTRLVVVAAGALGARGMVNQLMNLTRSSDPFITRAAAVSLAQIADPSTIATAQALTRHPDPLVRSASIQLLSKFPSEGLMAGRTMSSELNEQTARNGIAILGAIGSPEALSAIGPFLGDPRPGVRIEALIQLQDRFPVTAVPGAMALRTDPVELVRLVALSTTQNLGRSPDDDRNP